MYVKQKSKLKISLANSTLPFELRNRFAIQKRALSRNHAVEKHADAKRGPFRRTKCEIVQCWIESLNGEWSNSATKDSLLPEGEGQDEGEPHFITERRVIFARSERPPSTASFRLRDHCVSHGAPPSCAHILATLQKFFSRSKSPGDD
jgi:hypothetical protein